MGKSGGKKKKAAPAATSAPSLQEAADLLAHSLTAVKPSSEPTDAPEKKEAKSVTQGQSADNSGQERPPAPADPGADQSSRHASESNPAENKDQDSDGKEKEKVVKKEEGASGGNGSSASARDERQRDPLALLAAATLPEGAATASVVVSDHTLVPTARPHVNLLPARTRYAFIETGGPPDERIKVVERQRQLLFTPPAFFGRGMSSTAVLEVYKSGSPFTAAAAHSMAKLRLRNIERPQMNGSKNTLAKPGDMFNSAWLDFSGVMESTTIERLMGILSKYKGEVVEPGAQIVETIGNPAWMWATASPRLSDVDESSVALRTFNILADEAKRSTRGYYQTIPCINIAPDLEPRVFRENEGITISITSYAQYGSAPVYEPMGRVARLRGEPELRFSAFESLNFHLSASPTVPSLAGLSQNAATSATAFTAHLSVTEAVIGARLLASWLSTPSSVRFLPQSPTTSSSYDWIYAALTYAFIPLKAWRDGGHSLLEAIAAGLGGVYTAPKYGSGEGTFSKNHSQTLTRFVKLVTESYRFRPRNLASRYCDAPVFITDLVAMTDSRLMTLPIVHDDLTLLAQYIDEVLELIKRMLPSSLNRLPLDSLRHPAFASSLAYILMLPLTTAHNYRYSGGGEVSRDNDVSFKITLIPSLFRFAIEQGAVRTTDGMSLVPGRAAIPLPIVTHDTMQSRSAAAMAEIEEIRSLVVSVFDVDRPYYVYKPDALAAHVAQAYKFMRNGSIAATSPLLSMLVQEVIETGGVVSADFVIDVPATFDVNGGRVPGFPSNVLTSGFLYRNILASRANMFCSLQRGLLVDTNGHQSFGPFPLLGGGVLGSTIPLARFERVTFHDILQGGYATIADWLASVKDSRLRYYLDVAYEVVYDEKSSKTEDDLRAAISKIGSFMDAMAVVRDFSFDTFSFEGLNEPLSDYVGVFPKRLVLTCIIRTRPNIATAIGGFADFGRPYPPVRYTQILAPVHAVIYALEVDESPPTQDQVLCTARAVSLTAYPGPAAPFNGERLTWKRRFAMRTLTSVAADAPFTSLHGVSARDVAIA